MFGGQLLSVISLFKHLFYMIFGFDNIDHYHIINILEWYNIISKPASK